MTNKQENSAERLGEVDISAGAANIPSAEDVRSIGEIIRDTRNLTAAQVSKILEHQQNENVRFGEAAIALGYATAEDVLHALALQFNYAYGNEERRQACPELVAFHQPFSAQAEAIRAIRSQVVIRATGQNGPAGLLRRKALAIVSPNTGDGKTFFSANLAVSLAQLGGKTLIVDADLRGPRLHDVFDADSKTGLAGLLSGRRGENVIKAVRGISNLYLLPVGICPPNPLELLQGPAFGVVMQELLTKFDHVIVDTPASQYGADGMVVAARCGLALIVTRKNENKVEKLREVAANLVSAGVEVVGIAFNEHA